MIGAMPHFVPGQLVYNCQLTSNFAATTVTMTPRQIPKVPDRLPDGRLPWIHPINCTAWTISPSCEEESSRSRTYKLHRKGWTGVCTTNLSRWEERQIKKFVDSREGGVYKCRRYTERVGDERPGDLGSFKCTSRSFYFERREDRDRLLAMVKDEFPKRLGEMLVNASRLPPEVAKLLQPYNWHFSPGTHANLITMQQDVPDTVVMTLKLMLS